MQDIKLYANGKTNKANMTDYLMYRNRSCEIVAKDFQTYTETGFYSWDDTAVLTQCANRPCDEAGTLEVLNNKSTANPIIYHRYLTDTNKIYLNSCVNSVWGSWVMTADQGYVDEALGNLENDLSNMQSSLNQINQNVAKKINRTDTKTFFLEPSKWTSEGKYTLDITDFGWTSNTIIQINAPMPESNVELASGISIESQTSTSVVLKAESVPTDPVILTLLYGGEETSGYYCIDEVGTQTIIVEEQQIDDGIVFIANPDAETVSMKDIHVNNLSFTMNKVSGSSSVNSLYGVKFGDNYLSVVRECQYLVDISSTNFDASKPWIFHTYCYFSNQFWDTVRITRYVGFYKNDTNQGLISISHDFESGNSVKWICYRGLGISAIGTYEQSIPNGGRVTQLKIIYDGTSIKFYIMDTHVWVLIATYNVTINSGDFTGIALGSGKDSTMYANFGTMILKQGTELPEIVEREDWGGKENWSSYHLVEVEKEIQITEKSWYNSRSDGLYKWDDIQSVPFEADENTILLLHGDEIIDSSLTPKTITNNGVTVSEEQSRTNGKSLYFNGSSYLSLNNSNINFGSDDFTIEWWQYPLANQGTIISVGNTGMCPLVMNFDTDCGIYSSSDNTNWNILEVRNGEAVDKDLNVWTHFAFVRQGDNFKMYKNGKLHWNGASKITSTVFTNAVNTVIGNHTNSKNFYGYIDELRISNIARYTSDFDVSLKGWVKQESEVQ